MSDRKLNIWDFIDREKAFKMIATVVLDPNRVEGVLDALSTLPVRVAPERLERDRDSIRIEISRFLARDIVEAVQGVKSPYLMALCQEIRVQLAGQPRAALSVDAEASDET